MTKTYKIAILIGSLRQEAYSRKLAAALEKNAPANLNFVPVKIDDLPFYNEDLETNAAPKPWLRLREQIAAADGVMFVVPEYNRSLPAALKNALDVGSRPFGQSVWSGKPALAVSLSQGPMGGYGANQHLRQTLAVLNMPYLLQPETYIGKVQDLTAHAEEAGNKQFLSNIMHAYARFLAKQLG